MEVSMELVPFMMPEEMSLPQTARCQHSICPLSIEMHSLNARFVKEAITPLKASGDTSLVYADAQIGKKLMIAPLSN